MIKRIAPVLGVVAVIAAILAIALNGVSHSPEEHDAARLTADLETRSRVRSAFALSKRLSVYDIGVSAANGIVTLGGDVPTATERELAESVAREVEGAKTVENRIQVDAGTRPSEARVREAARVADFDIRAEVRERLSFDPDLRDRRVFVGVKDRVVKLKGSVATSKEKAHAESIARAARDALSVDNEIVVADIRSVGSGSEPPR